MVVRLASIRKTTAITGARRKTSKDDEDLQDGQIRMCRTCHLPQRGHICSGKYEPARQQAIDDRKRGIAPEDGKPQFGVVDTDKGVVYGVYGRKDRREIAGYQAVSWEQYARTQEREGDDIWNEECYVCNKTGKVNPCYECNLVAHPRCLVRKLLPRGLSSTEEMLCPTCVDEAISSMEKTATETNFTKK